MKKTIKLTESDLKRIITEAVMEAESEGWEVDDNRAQEAYELFCREYGEDEANKAIVRSLGNVELAKCLAYVFRCYEFRQWKDYQLENNY